MTLERYRRPVVVAAPTDTAMYAAAQMRDQRVGCVVVLRHGRVAGIVTDRDLALRVVAEGRDPETTLLADVCTPDPVTVDVGSGIETVLSTMRAHGIRRVPVVEAGGVVGIVTADDLAIAVGEQAAALRDAIEAAADAPDNR